MVRTILICTFCAAGVAAIAEEISPKVEKVIQLGEIRRKERISELEGGLKVLKAQYEKVKKEAEMFANSQMTQATGRQTTQAELKKAAEDKMQNIKDRAIAIKQEIEQIKAQKYILPNIVMKSMKVGDIGVIVDSYGAQQTAKITQIVDGENLIISVDAQFLWLVADTEGLKPGKKFSMTMPFEVTGTTTHKSVGNGTKKMFVLEQFFFPEEDEPETKQVTSTGAKERR